MKKLAYLCLLLMVSCETGVQVNLQCVLKHTAEVVKLESGLLGTEEKVFVNLTWDWTFQKPEGDAVIVKRSIGDSLNFVQIDTIMPIDTVMYCIDSDTILHANGLVYYKLAFLNGKAVDDFITTEVKIPASQHFYSPSVDTIGNDTVQITFAKLQDFNDYSIGIYKAISTDIESLLNFTNPLFSTATSDTTIIVSMPDSTYPDNTPYTIKVSSSKLLPLITDTSIGFRAFFKRP